MADKSNQPEPNNARSGQKITVPYTGRSFEVIVIDPNGIAHGSPSVGLGFRMMEKYAGIPHATLSQRVVQIGDEIHLKSPSGNTFRVVQMKGSDGNNYNVVEARDWVELIQDWLLSPGKTSDIVKKKMMQFLFWFAVKGFYSSVYATIKGAYTSKDDRVLSQWMESRINGIYARNHYTDLLKDQGCASSQYAHWTDYVYLGLFGIRAAQMRKIWETVKGNPNIARNHIQESVGLEAVKYVEDLVLRVFVDNLQEAHDISIAQARKKYGLGSADLAA